MVQEVEGSMVMNPPHAVITWHPYPQEKPPVKGRYIVTDWNGRVRVLSFLKSGYFTYDGRGFIKAWAELPKAYEP